METPRFQYTLYGRLKPDATDELRQERLHELNQLGREGWEVVGMVPRTGDAVPTQEDGDVVLLLKREI